MKKVYLELTNSCNLNCKMCYRKAWNNADITMDEQLVDKLINEIASEESVKEIVFGGIGEPLFYDGFCHVIKKLSHKDIKVTTNGTIMEPQHVASLCYYCNEVIISVDGLSDNFYATRDFPLDEVLLHIQELKSFANRHHIKGPKISLQMVLTKDNYSEILEVISLAKSYDVDKVILSNIIPVTMADNELAIYKMYDKEPLQSIFQKAISSALLKKIELVLPEVMLKTDRRCPFIEEEAVMVNASGHIVPCYRFSHDGSEVVFGRFKTISQHSFGHIADFTLKEVYNNDAYKIFRHDVRCNFIPSCPDCDLVDGCDLVNNSEMDCYGNTPSCADCLWARRIAYCS